MLNSHSIVLSYCMIFVDSVKCKRHGAIHTARHINNSNVMLFVRLMLK